MKPQETDEAARWARMVEAEERAFALLDDALPAHITDPDELWRCNFCPVRHICEKEHP